MTCLGDVVAALVDGELDHAARERAQRHLAHCADCRAEVDAQRRLKSRLSGVSVDPSPSDALTARLLGLTSQPPPFREGTGADGAPPLVARPARPLTAAARGAARPVTLRTAGGPGSVRPGSARSRLRRRAGVGSALVALGLGAALALGGPQPSRPSTPVDPGTDAFVVDFVSTTGGSGGAGSGR